MPENLSSNSTPGLSSISYDKMEEKKPLSNVVNTNPAPVKTDPSSVETKPLTTEIVSSKKMPSQYTSSSFKVGKKNYYIVNDNSKTRNLIKWDENGNVDPASPVQVIGKNVNGGFVLAAEETTPNIEKSKFEFNPEKGINFHNIESDQPGTVPTMQTIHNKSFDDLGYIANPKAAAQLRGIYKRTGLL